MNWPPLHNRTSAVLADVLRSAVHTKPKDLFDFVAQVLEKESGQDPAAFEQFFEECKRKPRTYVLEDRCPAGHDPMIWVPMRFNDDTILASLKAKLHEVTSEILSAISIDDTRAFLDRVCIAMPELMYLRAAPSEPVASQSNFMGAELAAFQAIRGVYVCFSGCEQPTLDDELVEFSFSCETLTADSRKTAKEFALDTMGLETLMVFTLLRCLGAHEPFQRRFGGGFTDPTAAALHAMEHEVGALPSFFRLTGHQQELIKACLQVWLPLEMLYTTEAVPGHFMSIKETLTTIEDGLDFLVCAMTVDNVVNMRNSVMLDEAVDLIRVSGQSLRTLDKHSPARAYESLLKKRAEVHSWRIVRDDYLLKAVVRICCFMGHEDTEQWNAVLNVVEELAPNEKEVLKRELAVKDGCAEMPAYVLLGAGRFMDAAFNNPDVGLRPAVVFLVRLLEEAARTFDKLASRTNRMVRVDVGSLTRRAREFAGGIQQFQDTPFQMRETVGGIIAIELAGGGDGGA